MSALTFARRQVEIDAGGAAQSDAISRAMPMDVDAAIDFVSDLETVYKALANSAAFQDRCNTLYVGASLSLDLQGGLTKLTDLSYGERHLHCRLFDSVRGCVFL